MSCILSTYSNRTEIDNHNYFMLSLQWAAQKLEKQGQFFNMSMYGVGTSLSQLMYIPGCSKYINSINYDYDELNGKSFSAVSPQALIHVSSGHMDNYGIDKDEVRVYATGAISTNRYRQGLHHAYFLIQTYDNTDGQLYYIRLKKPYNNEQQYNQWIGLHGRIGLINHRVFEDQIISMDILQRLINNDEILSNRYLEWIEERGQIF